MLPERSEVEDGLNVHLEHLECAAIKGPCLNLREPVNFEPSLALTSVGDGAARQATYLTPKQGGHQRNVPIDSAVEVINRFSKVLCSLG